MDCSDCGFASCLHWYHMVTRVMPAWNSMTWPPAYWLPAMASHGHGGTACLQWHHLIMDVLSDFIGITWPPGYCLPAVEWPGYQGVACLPAIGSHGKGIPASNGITQLQTEVLPSNIDITWNLGFCLPAMASPGHQGAAFLQWHHMESGVLPVCNGS